MKRIIFLFFAVNSAFMLYSQTSLQEGDRCFDTGDYSCAINYYNDAYIFASGEDKQLVEIKLTRARNCAEWIKEANQAFANRNYNLAKENYQKLLESNPKDEYAKSQWDKCENFLNPPPPPATTLSVSTQTISFAASGGSSNITVTTNAQNYNITSLPSWCTITKYSGYFVLNCSANTGNTSRNEWFKVTAGDKEVRIDISQSGMVTNLSVSTTNLSFSASGGAQEIKVTTNAGKFDISGLPDWCSVTKYANSFTLYCFQNTRYSARNYWFWVSAGGKDVRININQSAKAVTSSNNNSSYNYSNQYTYKPRKCFNCPGEHFDGGLSVGYVFQSFESNNYSVPLEGLQIGLRYEPLFNYGFGINTGIFYEHYFKSYLDWNNNPYKALNKRTLNIPLHLEYRLNFSQYFSLFFLGGGSVDLEYNYENLDNFFENGFLDCLLYWDAGGGVRINRVQVNIGMNMGETRRKSYISLSYILPWN